MNDRPLLLRRHPHVAERAAWMPLGQYPTRIHRVQDALAPEVELWVKREDESSSLYGGNKIRKLEFIIAEAKRRGADRLLTMGSFGSHHVLATGMHGRASGMQVDAIVMPQPITKHVQENLLADVACGIRLHYASSYWHLVAQIAWRSLRRRTYFVTGGGSSPVGTLGYVSAALEIAEQIQDGTCPRFDVVYLPLGSCGMAAGLWLGFRLAKLPMQVVAVQALEAKIGSQKTVLRLARQTNQRYQLGADLERPETDLRFDARFIGPGYGSPTEEAQASIADAAEVGLDLEITYTSRAWSALRADTASGRLNGKKVLYVYTYSGVDLSPLIAESPGADAMPPAIARVLDATPEL